MEIQNIPLQCLVKSAYHFEVFCVYGFLQHLHSDHHRAFALDISNYTHVDQLVAEMVPEFSRKLPTRCEDMQNM